MATSPASKLATKIDRMAPNGYYVVYYGTPDEDLSKRESFEVQHIKDGAARYIHFLFATGAPGGSWSVLTWSCALTKNGLAREQKALAAENVERTLYFATHAELLKFPHIGLQPGALVPSPLDI
jgi:hypothetical protein